VSKQLPKVATQWNSGMTWESNRVHRARIPSALTTRPLSHTPLDSYCTESVSHDQCYARPMVMLPAAGHWYC